LVAWSTEVGSLERDELGLTGTHVGCDTSNCGVCTVKLDGDTVKSCTVLAAQADGHEVQTIEGLARNGDVHPRLYHAGWGRYRELGGAPCGPFTLTAR